MMGKNIFFTSSNVSQEQREKILGQKGAVIWLTGFSGSGKSTIAKVLESRLASLGRAAYILDGDNIRHGLNSDLGFSDADRSENIRRIGEVAALFADAGIITVTAFISPFAKDRALARSILRNGRFYEIYVYAPIDLCEKRDPKGLYKKAREKGIDHFTGIDSSYEAPENPDLKLDTGKLSAEESVEEILEFLKQNKIF